MTMTFNVDENTLIESLIPHGLKCDPPADQWEGEEFISDVNKRYCLKHDNSYGLCVNYYNKEYERIEEVLNQYVIK